MLVIVVGRVFSTSQPSTESGKLESRTEQGEKTQSSSSSTTSSTTSSFTTTTQQGLNFQAVGVTATVTL